MQDKSFVAFKPEEVGALSQKTLVATHNLHETSLFSDESLIKLLDNHNRDCLYAHTMGEDPENPSEWYNGTTDKLTGEELLTAVKRGKLWLNIVKIGDFHPQYKELLDEMYEQIEAQAEHFRSIRRSYTLLISSPKSMVFYHADPYDVFLWQLRGKKRVYVYPFEETFAPTKSMERIFTREAIEDLPYSLDFDEHAEVLDLNPGQMVSWAQNSPHRVVNLEDVNISITSNHYTDSALRREFVYSANRYFKRLGIPASSTATKGLLADSKIFAFRALRKLNIHALEPYNYKKTFVVDPQAPQGFRFLSNP
ncbi:MAG: cupin-like domain-containing protein [Pseudobacteriovorax sp.]|nr:cupin-like domain-containing protein [Pseudobacteriovorax sp.]